MDIVNLGSDEKINSLAKRVAEKMFGDVNTTVGILISRYHDLISFPVDRFGHSSTLAVMIPKDGHKKYINFFTDCLEVKGRFNEQLEYIILIGRRALGAPEEKQIDIFKHELQHVKQNHLKPDILAKDRLLDIALDLFGETEQRTPSEMDAKSIEQNSSKPLSLWVKRTNLKFEQYKSVIDNLHKAIIKGDSVIQKKINNKQVTKIISPELADLFEFYYKKVATSGA